MKIGILTHHYVKNFGAYMQAKALLSVIKELYPEANVEFIDYCVNIHRRANVIHFLGYKPKRGDTILGFEEKIKLFFSHRKAEHSLPRSKKMRCVEEINAQNYNLIIIGSDEVWNFNDIAYSPIKFGDGLKCAHITYSVSAGGSTASDKNIPEVVRRGIKSFKEISVRDENTEELVEMLGDRKAIRTLDPVYLYDYNLIVREHIKKIVEEKPYVLIYDCRLEIEQVKAIIKYARENDYRILGAGEFRKWYATTATTNINPYEWAYLFRNAKAVITGTFHGTSFAIKYNRLFVSYLTELNRVSKVGSLLDEFDLKDRIVGNDDDIIKVLVQPIDYNNVNKILSGRKEASINYIQRCLDEIR